MSLKNKNPQLNRVVKKAIFGIAHNQELPFDILPDDSESEIRGMLIKELGDLRLEITHLWELSLLPKVLLLDTLEKESEINTSPEFEAMAEKTLTHLSLSRSLITIITPKFFYSLSLS